MKRHVINIDYDKKLIGIDILFLTEAQVSQVDYLSDIQSILEEYTLDHNTSSFRYSSLASCYKSTTLFYIIRKMDFIFPVFKQTFLKSYHCGSDA